MTTSNNVFQEEMMEVSKSAADHSNTIVQSISRVCAREYWAEVDQAYRGRFGNDSLPTNRIARIARFIFTEDGQIAYSLAKAKRKEAAKK